MEETNKSDPNKNKLIDLSKKDRHDVLPWIEKYRPTSFDEIISHKTVVNVLKKTIKDNKLQHLLFSGSPGTGKCLDLTTPVMLFNGHIKEAQYIKTGDILMGDDNTPRTVLSTTTGEDVMYRIIQSKGDDYIVNSEHIISLKLSNAFQEKWLEEENKYILLWLENHCLKQKSFTVINNNNSKYKNNFESRDEAYEALKKYKKKLIDNNIANKEGDICDISIKDYLKKQIYWKNIYKGFKSQRINCWPKKSVHLDPYILGYWLCDKSNNMITKNFLQQLEKYNFAKDKYVPDDYKYNDVEIRLQLLAGFLDANGYLNKFNKFVFTQKSKRLYDDIVFISRSLGLTVSVMKSKYVNNIEYYRCSIYGKGLKNIPNKIIYKPLMNKYYKNSDLYDIKIEKLSRGKYCGFELDGNGRFLLGDFTVTHNTSMIMACARKLYGDKIDLMTLNINASEERGIEVVRGRIQEFVNAKIIHSENNKSVFKLVILDEADAMTADAQAMLRKVIENYSYCTRFCLICNYIKKITPALQSRCACYKFPPLKPKDIRKKILSVAKLEAFNITEDGIETIIKRSKGDMRIVLNILQSISMSYDVITGSVINQCISYPDSIDIKKIMESLINDNFETSYKIISDIKSKNSYSLQDIITEISSELILISTYPKLNKYKNLDPFSIISIIKILSQIEYNLTTCITESLQLSALVAAFKSSKF